MAEYGICRDNPDLLFTMPIGKVFWLHDLNVAIRQKMKREADRINRQQSGIQQR